MAPATWQDRVGAARDGFVIGAARPSRRWQGGFLD